MNHFKVIVFCVFALALSAGLVAGKLDWRPARAPAKTDASPLASELNLTPAQCDQIRAIWEPLRKSASDSYVEARRLDTERDAALDRMLDGILTKDQKDRYNKIKSDYQARALALQARRNEEFRQAVANTKQLLDPSQRQKYEELIKDRLNPDQAAGVAVGNGRTDTKMIPEAE